MIDSILALITQILPLYVIAGLGFAAGKFFKIDNKSIASLVIFIISPVVFILSISKLEFTAAAIYAPILILTIAIILSWIVIRACALYTDKKGAYLLGLASSTSNWGYFGLPIAFAFFPIESIAIFMVLGFGLQIFDNTFGLYYVGRGTMSPKDSLINLFKYPVIYALLIGLGLSAFNVSLPAQADDFLTLFKGAYTVLGMMLIGLGLSTLDKFRLDWAFILSAFALKFLIWPTIAIGLIHLDRSIGLLGSEYYKPLLLLSIMPMAANNIAYAAKFDMGEGRVSIAVLITTLFAIIYVPVMIEVLGLK